MKKKKGKKGKKQQEIRKIYNTNIKRPYYYFVIYGKHTIYFIFLKRFIGIHFVKTVRQISFYASSTGPSSLILLMYLNYLYFIYIYRNICPCIYTIHIYNIYIYIQI